MRSVCQRGGRVFNDFMDGAQKLLLRVKFFALDLFGFRRGGLDEQKIQMLGDSWASPGLHKNLLLCGVKTGKEIAAVNVVTIFLHRLHFRRAEIPSRQQGEEKNKDARKSHHSRNHSEVILHLAERVAARQLAAQRALDEAEQDSDDNGAGDVRDDVAKQEAEN